jgi:hypothetical protein
MVGLMIAEGPGFTATLLAFGIWCRIVGVIACRIIINDIFNT